MSASDPISEKVRWALMRRLIEVLGEEEAETLMESLPPVVWHQIATKDDLAALEKRLMAEISGLKGEFAGLKGEFVGLKGEFAGQKGEIVGLKGEIALQLARMTRTMVLTFISVSVAMLGAMTAIVHTAPA